VAQPAKPDQGCASPDPFQILGQRMQRVDMIGCGVSRVADHPKLSDTDFAELLRLHRGAVLRDLGTLLCLTLAIFQEILPLPFVPMIP
jgi:hypothetical protein